MDLLKIVSVFPSIPPEIMHLLGIACFIGPQPRNIHPVALFQSSQQMVVQIISKKMIMKNGVNMIFKLLNWLESVLNMCVIVCVTVCVCLVERVGKCSHSYVQVFGSNII